MNILYVFADNPREWNCSQWRCAVPTMAINGYSLEDEEEYGPLDLHADMLYIQEFAQQTDKAVELGKKADIIVIQRLVLATMIEHIIQYQALGKVVIGEVDDAYHLMPDNLNAYKFWHEGVVTVQGEDGKTQQAKMIIPPVEQLEWGIKLVNAVTAPSEQLLKDWKKFNPHVHHIPNFIDSSAYLPYKRQNRSNPHFTIGWGGSYSHLNSWKKSNIVEALHKIIDMHPGTKIAIAGGDRRIVEELKLKPQNLILHDWVSPDEWPKILATFDIGLVPLAGAYDARRSYIKTLEYMLMGIPWVGTKAPPTEFFSQYGGVVTNSVESWRRGINNAIVNWVNEKEKVDSGYNIALSLDIHRQVHWLSKTYHEIYQQYKRGD